MKLLHWLDKFFLRIYERRLSCQAREWKIPRHLGIVLDGNRRFARQQGMARVADGHARGADKIHEVLNWCFEAGVPVVTIWIFSLDNFNREPAEVTELLQLIADRTRELIVHEGIHRNQVRVKYIGRVDSLPPHVQEAIRDAEAATAAYTRLHLNVAIAYGGREEITDAFRQYLRDQAAQGHGLEQIAADLKPDQLDRYLYTSGLPDPDLIIRTSGEIRLSGFLLWQSAYSEYYFCDTYWPAFRKVDFLRALRSFHLRHRRFGK
jgi:short-chain Z-isoprenyl diphosphate synthase